MKKDPEACAVVFDLGNVIFPFSHEKAVKAIRRVSPMSPEEIYQEIFISGLEKAFDEGSITPREFHERLMKRLKMTMDYKSFVSAWNDIFELDREVEKLIRRLGNSGYGLYILSNTNELHFNYLSDNYSVMKAFDRYFLSFEIGLTKPDAGLFRFVLERVKLTGRDFVVYTDDKPEFVDVAISQGFTGIVFQGARQLERELGKTGFIF